MWWHVSHSECVEWAFKNGCRRNRGRHFGVWKKMVARGKIHERGRFTIREISFLWGLGFLGNPITGVKCDLGSWPYTVHRPSHRLSTVMVYTIGVSYLFGTDTNRRAPRCSMTSHSHGRFQPRSGNYFLKAFVIDIPIEEEESGSARHFSKASGMATQSRYYWNWILVSHEFGDFSLKRHLANCQFVWIVFTV